MPSRPKLAARGQNYAADPNEAERASPEIRHSSIRTPTRSSKPNTLYDRLSRTSTAGKFLFGMD
jgi:hypothetical protein